MRKNTKPLNEKISVSLAPPLLRWAETKADGEHAGVLSQYISSLVERDMAGHLWMGTATDPGNEKVIANLCEVWAKSDREEIAERLGEMHQPKLLRLLLDALVEYLKIRAAADEYYDSSRPLPQLEKLAIMPLESRDSIREMTTKSVSVLSSNPLFNYNDADMAQLGKLLAKLPNCLPPDSSGSRLNPQLRAQFSECERLLGIHLKYYEQTGGMPFKKIVIWFDFLARRNVWLHDANYASEIAYRSRIEAAAREEAEGMAQETLSAMQDEHDDYWDE